MPQDLKLTGDKFNIALTVFYVPYILIDVPSNWVVKYFQAGYYLPALMVCWGIVGMSMGFTKSYAGLIVCRLLLGLFEGGLLGGMIIYLAMFYRRHQLLFRIGLFYCAAPLSGAFGGLLATGLAEIRYGGYNSMWPLIPTIDPCLHDSLGWPWIFIVEGAITILFGILTMFFLPHTPSQSKFLTEEERHGAIRRMTLDAHGASAASDVAREKFSWRWVRMALLNWNTILLSITFFLLITPIYSYSLFLPTIISTLGYTRVTAQLFTVPPNIGAVISVLLVTYLSDKFKARGPFMLGGCSLAIIGYIMLLTGKRPQVQYGGTFLISAGVFPSSPVRNPLLPTHCYAGQETNLENQNSW